MPRDHKLQLRASQDGKCVVVSGDTYLIRNNCKAVGGKWRHGSKAWEFSGPDVHEVVVKLFSLSKPLIAGEIREITWTPESYEPHLQTSSSSFLSSGILSNTQSQPELSQNLSTDFSSSTINSSPTGSHLPRTFLHIDWRKISTTLCQLLYKSCQINRFKTIYKLELCLQSACENGLNPEQLLRAVLKKYHSWQGKTLSPKALTKSFSNLNISNSSSLSSNVHDDRKSPQIEYKNFSEHELYISTSNRLFSIILPYLSPASSFSHPDLSCKNDGKYSTYSAHLSFDESHSMIIFKLSQPTFDVKVGRLQRKFGGERLLFITFDPIRSASRNYKQFRNRVLTICGREYKSLIWKVSQETRVDCFFAIRGIGIPPEQEYTIEQVSNWIADVTQVKGASKAASRLSLALSRSIPTINLADSSFSNDNKFQKFQVLLGPDMKSPSGCLMTDGCGLCSPDVAAAIWSKLGFTFGRSRPDVFQFRLAHPSGIFKGLIVTCRDKNMPPNTVFLRHSMRKAGGPCSPLFISTDCTLDILQVNQSPKREERLPNHPYSQAGPEFLFEAMLNRQLINVLAACSSEALEQVLLNLQQAAVETIFTETMDVDNGLALASLKANVARQLSAYKNKESFQSSQSVGRYRTNKSPLPSLPPWESLTGKLLNMYLSGFPLNEPWFYNQLHTLTQNRINKLKFQGKVPTPGSAWLFAIPDPRSNSQWFIHQDSNSNQEAGDNNSSTVTTSVPDEESLLPAGCVFIKVDGIVITGAVCIGRNPSLHPGDIRKLQAVSCSGLDYLNNVAVFSVLGERSPLDEMAGGDYDGDRVLVIWNQDIVAHFSSHPPAPSTATTRTNSTSVQIRVDDRDLVVAQIEKQSHVKEIVEIELRAGHAPPVDIVSKAVEHIHEKKKQDTDEVPLQNEKKEHDIMMFSRIRNSFIDCLFDFSVGQLNMIHQSFVCQSPKALLRPEAKLLSIVCGQSLDSVKHGKIAIPKEVMEIKNAYNQFGRPHFNKLKNFPWYRCTTIEGQLFDKCHLTNSNRNMKTPAQVTLDPDLLSPGRSKFLQEATMVFQRWAKLRGDDKHAARELIKSCFNVNSDHNDKASAFYVAAYQGRMSDSSLLDFPWDSPVLRRILFAMKLNCSGTSFGINPERLMTLL